MPNYQFAYLIGDFIAFTVWLVLFIHRKDLRHKMLFLSIILGFIGPISEFWYLKDYWKPLTITNTPIGIEDYLFGFFVGGIASVLYEEFFSKKFSKRHLRKHHWVVILIMLMGITVVISNILFFILKINSVYVSIIAFLLICFCMLIFRKDLWFDAVASGLFLSVFFFLGYVVLLTIYPDLFNKMWHLQNLSGIYLGKIPIEEILWAFGAGMMTGPAYEFYAGLTLKKST